MNEDSLYQAPLGEFVAVRNQLAATLKKDGDADEAKRVKALAKPSTSAWAVNQLYWKERAFFDALIAAGDDLRKALESGPSEEAERRRNDAVGEALRRAKALVEASGQSASETLMRRIATTLDALASYGSANPSPMRGRLAEDVRPPGFGAFAALAPALPDVATPTPPTYEDEIERHEVAVERARTNLHEAATRVDQLESELTSLQDRLLKARQAAEETAIELAEAETELLEARAKTKSS